MPFANSGFFVTGQIRDIQKINYKQKELLLIARNNDSLETFELKK